MKAKAADVERGLKDLPATRFFLFYGPDEAGSRALAAKVGAAAGPDAERVSLSGAELKADPARLADEAASGSLFGGPRYILVEGGEEIMPALEALLEAPPGGNPVAIVAGALRPTSGLLKCALAAPDALACASYVPEGGDGAKVAREIAAAQGLTLRPDIARRIADSAAGNRAVMERELEKLALFVGAETGNAIPLEHDALDLVGAGAEEGDMARLVDAVASGDVAAAEAELSRLASEGLEGIPLLRALERRFALLAKLRAEVDRGNSVAAVMNGPAGRAIFWKEKDAVARQAGKWRSDLIARAMQRLIEAYGATMRVGTFTASEEMLAIARMAQRLG